MGVKACFMQGEEGAGSLQSQHEVHLLSLVNLCLLKKAIDLLRAILGLQKEKWSRKHRVPT